MKYSLKSIFTKGDENTFPADNADLRRNKSAIISEFCGNYFQMKKVILIFLASATVFTLSSCSKEKQLTNRLTGEWQFDLVVTVTKINGATSETDSSTSANTIEFKKDNTGTFSSSGSGSLKIPAKFTWSNTDVKLTLVDEDVPNAVYDFDVVDCDCKKSFEMSCTDTEEISGDTYTYDRTYFAIKTD